MKKTIRKTRKPKRQDHSRDQRALAIARQMVAKVTTVEALYSAINESECDPLRKVFWRILERDFKARHPNADEDEVMTHEEFLLGVAIGERASDARGGR